MNNHVLNGLASAMFSLGVLSAPVLASTYGAYTRTYSRQNQQGKVGQGDLSMVGTHETAGTSAITVDSMRHEMAGVEALTLVRPYVSSENRDDLLLQSSNNQALSSVELKKYSAIRELVIIDEAVEDKSTFYKDLKPGVEAHEIKSGEDGLVQLQNILQNYTLLQALHIVTHASDGEIVLGSTQVTEALLRSEINTLSSIDAALNNGADIFFYGCSLAKSEAGEELLELISREAHVDVAASNDLTGSAHLSGDWDLEIKKGNVDSSHVFSEIALLDYSHVLAFNGTINFSTVIVAGSYTGDASSVNAQVGGAGGYTLVIDGADFSTGASFGRAYSSYGESQITLEFSGGETFTPGSLYVYNVSGLTDTFIVTSDVGGYVSSGPLSDISGATLNLSSFGTGVSKVYISVQDGSGYVSMDDFVVSDVGAVVADSDGTLTAAGGVFEPVGLGTTVDSVGEAVNVFDFTLTDVGSADGNAMTVSQVIVNVSGTSTDTQRAGVTWRLNGSDATNVTGVYNSGSNTITFSGLSISVADGTSEIYTVNAFYNVQHGYNRRRHFYFKC